MTQSETLKSVAQALYGLSWQSELARALDVQPRTVRYWATGGNIKPAVWRKIYGLCRDRIPLLVEAMRAIEAL